MILEGKVGRREGKEGEGGLPLGGLGSVGKKKSTWVEPSG